MKRILLAGIIGGLIVFLWGAVSHMALPLGDMGMKTMPDEEVVISAMKSSLKESGLYFFPGMENHRNLSEREQKAWEAKYMAGPTGLLVYKAEGSKPLSPNQLLTELITNILAALIAAFLLSQTSVSFAARVLSITLLGLFSWLSISASYWNWYHFPGDFTAAEGLDQVVGWFLGGLALAAMVKGRIQQATGA
jgi:hypothetical protein